MHDAIRAAMRIAVLSTASGATLFKNLGQFARIDQLFLRDEPCSANSFAAAARICGTGSALRRAASSQIVAILLRPTGAL